jgi:MYXO-CTERM domain-containing protein
MKTSIAIGALALAAIAGSAFGGVDINGGSSWGGWDHRGNSLDVGIWGAGSTTRSYELYTTTFTSDGSMTSTGGSQVKLASTPAGFSAGAFSTGAFANGHTIIGIGLKMNGTASTAGGTFVSFGLHGNEFQAASALGASDGQVDDSVYGYAGDFAVWIDGASGNGPSNLGVYTTNGTGHGGTAGVTNLPGGFGSGVSYDYAFRQFRNGTVGGGMQMFFDLTAMQNLYSSSGANYISSPWSAGPGSIGAIGSDISFSMYNSNASYADGSQVAFHLPTSVPEPGAAALLAVGGLVATRRRR